MLKYGFYAVARGLAEIPGSIAWVSESPERLTSLVRTDQLGIKALVDAGRRKHPGLGDTYSALSNIVHPNRDAHLPLPRPNAQRIMSLLTLEFSDHFARQKTPYWWTSARASPAD